MSIHSLIYQFSTHDLPRRAGEMREYVLDLEITEPVGVELVSIPVGGVIEVDVRLESVTEGILITADIYAIAKGECIRCLDPVEIKIDRRFQELYRYEATNQMGRKSKKRAEPADDLDIDDELMMDGDIMDLEAPIRDAIVLDLPINTLCRANCLGICPGCGEKWEKLPEDHVHELIDPRWASLGALAQDGPEPSAGRFPE